VGANDTIGLATRDPQPGVTVDEEPSLWSHCFLLRELRLDRREPGKMKSNTSHLFDRLRRIRSVAEETLRVGDKKRTLS
jgi:hypothetical protein